MHGETPNHLAVKLAHSNTWLLRLNWEGLKLARAPQPGGLAWKSQHPKYSIGKPEGDRSFWATGSFAAHPNQVNRGGICVLHSLCAWAGEGQIEVLVPLGVQVSVRHLTA